MAINPNKPVQPSGFDKNSVSDMRNVVSKAAEAIADKVYDADGDNTELKDVGKAFNKLSPAEKTAFTAGTLVTGGALPALSLAIDGVGLAAKKVGEGLNAAAEAVSPEKQKASEKQLKEAAQEAKKAAEKTGKEVGKAAEKIADKVKEKYKNPPEAKLAEKIEDWAQDVGDAIEEFADDVKDGRIMRDIEKGAKRFWRDNFTEQSTLDKVKNKITDKAEDVADAAADALDDIKDGRTARKLKHAID